MTQRVTIVTLCHNCDTPGNPSIEYGLLLKAPSNVYITHLRHCQLCQPTIFSREIGTLMQLAKGAFRIHANQPLID